MKSDHQYANVFDGQTIRLPEQFQSAIAKGVTSSRASFEELGWKFEAATVSLDSGPAALLAGDSIAAEAELRADFDRLEKMGRTEVLAEMRDRRGTWSWTPFLAAWVVDAGWAVRH